MLSTLKAWLARRARRHTVCIDVTLDDIERGRACSSASCPIALAARRMIPCQILHVKGSELVIIKSMYVIRVVLPEAARTFVKRYDHLLAVEPFKFEISFLNRRS